MTRKQIKRIQHPLWAEYQEDACGHWYALADVGACDCEPGCSEQMDKIVDELTSRFRRTFYPEMP